MPKKTVRVGIVKGDVQASLKRVLEEVKVRNSGGVVLETFTIEWDDAQVVLTFSTD